ncbi:MAG: SMP-30/gluconolactonase/LRE family protein [Acidimicrobiaceae bacterium]|nr:SMP-30/gluconolactonase/LRE family protein [Acidimicrobiaceae bacterium]MYI36612.1 SMP-30/gluconolactonase/LRE family protein [Acidimicrobiaceae bacterium]
MINAEVVHAAEAALGEGCVWSPVENLLIWVDINGQAVHRFDHDTSQPVGLWRYPDTVGNAAPRAGGGLALGLGSSVALTDRVGAIETVIELPGEPESNRTNDGAVDPRGRLFQGTMSHAEPGAPVASLYRVDGDGTTRRVLSDVMISNGIGWSPDQTTMYYIDTLTFRVDRFDYDPDTGEIEGRRPFVTFDGSTGGPDGMTVDADGCLWVAMFGGYHVQRFSPDGEKLEAVITPGSPQATCCCFGGPELDTLYITTGREPIAGVSTDDEPNAGALFAADVDAVGVPTNLFAG